MQHFVKLERVVLALGDFSLDHQIALQGEAPHPWDVLPLADDQEYSDELAAAIDDPTVRDADDSFTPDTYDDTYLSIELTLPQHNNGEPITGRVVK